MVPSKYSKYATSFRYSYKVKFKLEQPMKTQSGSICIALHFSKFGAKWLHGQRHVPAALPTGNPVPICRSSWVGPRTVYSYEPD